MRAFADVRDWQRGRAWRASNGLSKKDAARTTPTRLHTPPLVHGKTFIRL
jgi:hypothetical protein